MENTIDTIVAGLRYIMWFLLIISVVFIILFATRYKAMLTFQSKVMAYNDTIAAYIQKNGGLVLKPNQTEQEFYRLLAQNNDIEELVCPDGGECLTTIKLDESTKGNSQHRSKVYIITTKYALLMPTAPNVEKTKGYSKVWRSPDSNRPIVSRAYITEYRNY